MNKSNTNTFKHLIFIILACVVVLSACCFCCACNKSSNNNGQNIQDLRGKTIKLDLPINKVASAHNPTLNHLIILGNGTSKYLIGFGRKDIAQNLYGKILPDWNSLEIIGNDSAPANKETILTLNPDLIILPEYNWEAKEKVFDGINIPTFVCFPKEESIESVMQSLDMLSKLFCQEDRANTIKNKYYQIIEEVEKFLENNSNFPKTVFLGPRDNSIATNNMMQNQIIEIAGGQNCTPDNIGDHFASIEPEVLISKNPEYIFIPTYAEYSVNDILANTKLSNISAVKNGHVYKFPSNLEPWDMPTCSSALGIAWLANKLHPESYSQQKLINEAIDFYQLLYNHKFSQEEFGLD